MNKKIETYSLLKKNGNNTKTDANNKKQCQPVTRSVHISGSRGSWHRSSRKDPCIICGRTKDGKCAYGESEIHCYNGTTNYPQSDMKIGEVYKTKWGTTGSNSGKRKWALVTKSGGWSGNHYVFIPDRKKNKTEYLYNQKLKEKISRNKLNKLFNIVFANLEKALFKDLALLNLKQLEKVSLQVQETMEEVNIFLDLCKQYRTQEINRSSQLSNLIENTRTFKNQLNLRQNQIFEFRSICLGEEINAK
tara:strand:- start:12 stop:755 length:744 start_codon:yes stop_codon:yes gene_type:complete